MAVLKALPTKAEILASGCVDAGEYLLQLKERNEKAYHAFQSERATRWGDEPKQPVPVCVEHILTVIIRQIEGGTRGADNLELTQSEVDQWVRTECHERGLLNVVR